MNEGKASVCDWILGGDVFMFPEGLMMVGNWKVWRVVVEDHETTGCLVFACLGDVSCLSVVQYYIIGIPI